MTDEITEPTAKAPATKAVRTPALPKDIISIIPLIRQELGAIAKDQVPEAGTKFHFRGHDQVINAIAPLFNKYGVFTTVEDTLLRYEGRNAGSKYATASVLAKKVTFFGPDGSSVSSTVVGESVDYGNKATGQAGTYAYRIAITQTFTIPTGEPDPDSNNEDLEPTATPAQPTPVAAAEPTSEEIKKLRAQVAEGFKARGITDKEEIIKLGTRYFNGRENWVDQPVPLNKLIKALAAGEVVGE